MGERVVVASRLPSYAQDHAFCFECGSFFQLPGANFTPQCSRCGGSFVQFLHPPGGEHWIRADSASGVNFSFDDQLESSITASLDETPSAKRPTQAAFLRILPTVQLTEAEVEVRAKLDERDPKCNCAICREGFCTVHPVKRLPCGHEFHDNCIVTWLQGNSSCPICRYRLPEAAEGEEVEDDADETLQCLKRPTSARQAAAAAVVGVPPSAAAAGTPVGNHTDGVAEESSSNGLEADDASAVLRYPSPPLGISGAAASE